MTGRIRTALLGATGYAGVELARLLGNHPQVEKLLLLRRNGVTKDSYAAELFSASPDSNGFDFHPLDWGFLKRHEVQLLLLATPHQVSRSLVPEAIAEGLRVIDLSGAWRLKQAKHRSAYGFRDEDSITASELTSKAVYGLPELSGDCIAAATLVANPGCYATSIILALAPLLKADLINCEHGIISDSKSGVSGAGKEPTERTHFVSVADNLSAYSVFNHRHCGEIVEQLNISSSEFIFTPHLLPIPRGIMSTIYVRLKCMTKESEIESCYRAFYAGKRWVRVFATPRLPQIRFALHTNYCDLGFCLSDDGWRLVIVSCVDNLLKGAAGQAVQNMNVMYGWGEEKGLQ